MLKTRNMIDVNVELVQWFIIFYASFIDNIRDADLADMQLISKFNKGIRFRFFVFEIYSKYSWVIALKDRKKYCNY